MADLFLSWSNLRDTPEVISYDFKTVNEAFFPKSRILTSDSGGYFTVSIGSSVTESEIDYKRATIL